MRTHTIQFELEVTTCGPLSGLSRVGIFKDYLKSIFMHLTIKYTKLDSTPAIDLYIRTKVGELDKLIKGINKKGTVEADLEIARITRHHKKGMVFRAKCDLVLPGKTLWAESLGGDVRRCIDEVRIELQQELKKYMSKMRPQDSRNQERLRKLRGKE